MGEDIDSNKSDDDEEEPVETAKTDDNEKIVVMIPESSSESSLGEFSPLFSQVGHILYSGLVLCIPSQEGGQDHLTKMFSDAEDGGVHEDHEQEDDFLSKIDDHECEGLK